MTEQPSLPISGLVITYNEEANIRDCILSLKTVCDDIVVVDSCSQDKTVEIAKSLGATVLIQPFLGDGPQRIFGLPHCQHSWVLNLDADERLEDDAIAAIKELSLDQDGVDVYELRRNNYIGDRLTHLAGQYPDYVARLFNKSTANFSPVRAHTRVKGQKHQRLTAHIRHYSYKNWSDLFSRQCKYATWGAEELAKRGKAISPFAPFTHGLWSFVRHYVVKLGLFAGLDGLTIAIAKALGAYLKYAHAIELMRQKKTKDA